MIATLRSAFRRRICINLDRGQSEAENASEGIRWGKKSATRSWTKRLDPEGVVDRARSGDLRRQFYQLKDAQIASSAAEALPEVLSRRRFEAGLGDLGQALRRPSLLGDTYERIRTNWRDPRMAARHGRATISASAWPQIVAGPTEKEAWEFAMSW